MLHILFDSSVYVVMGFIDDKFCSEDEAGVLNCIYTVAVIEVLNGSPTMQSRSESQHCREYQEKLQGTVQVSMTHFSYPVDNSFGKENPYDICDNVVLFLVDPASMNNPHYVLADRWLGVHESTCYLVRQLERYK